MGLFRWWNMSLSALSVLLVVIVVWRLVIVCLRRTIVCDSLRDMGSHFSAFAAWRRDPSRETWSFWTSGQVVLLVVDTLGCYYRPCGLFNRSCTEEDVDLELVLSPDEPRFTKPRHSATEIMYCQLQGTFLSSASESTVSFIFSYQIMSLFLVGYCYVSTGLTCTHVTRGSQDRTLRQP
jgi:hypothetical protein